MTLATETILVELVAKPGDELYGLGLVGATGLASGIVYPVLRRLECHGWVVSRFETPSEESAGRPLRRYYQLTDKGRELAEETLAARGAARRVTRRALALASVQ